MIITAKFASTCPCCSAPIQIGSKVEWSRGQKAVHASCAGRPATASTSSTSRPSGRGYARREPLRRRPLRRVRRLGPPRVGMHVGSDRCYDCDS